MSAFPSDFVWGAATSAYQIEGSPLSDGAGPSNWHLFCREPGRILGGDTGDVACDHYRRYVDDVTLMAELGLQAYRFSVSWSRILPEGRGRLNASGIAFYRRLVDVLLERGITPFATLFHWDLPAALAARGGWTHPDCAHWFAEYAQALFRELGEGIGHWATLNEPWVVVDAGYVNGIHPPGERRPDLAPLAAHNLLRGHGLAVQAFRADGRGEIGLVVNIEPKFAYSNEPADRSAMERSHAYMNRQFLDPALLGSYPEELEDIYREHWPRFPESDLRLIQQPIDFVGLNYYSRSVVRDDPAGDICRVSAVRQSSAQHTAMDWEVFPEGLGSALRWINRRYGDLPLYVTENGAAFDDAAGSGPIVDQARLDYLRRHLLAARSAISDGVPLRGYFVWSLFDNFEWSYGYGKRFGIVGVDLATQRRTIKASGRYYADVIRSNGGLLADD
ncbi:MAG: GH1 family beta-glucosidase [Methylotetracoccus sp.]